MLKSLVKRYQIKRRERTLLQEARIKALHVQGQLELLATSSEESGTGNQCSEEIVVSLTSYPGRINTLFLVIESLLRQTLRPDRLLLWLSREDFPGERDDLPFSLLQQEARGLEIHFVDDNLRSYKKIVHTLEVCPDSIVITVDDDLMYPVDLVDLLYLNHRRHPHDVVCNRGRRLTLDASGQLAAYKHWPLLANQAEASLYITPTGNFGVLYPIGSLHADVTDKEVHQKLAPLGDDLWLKTMSLRNGVQSRVISDRRQPRTRFLAIPYTRGPGLRDSNCSATGGNDTQMLALWNHYELQKYLNPSSS